MYIWFGELSHVTQALIATLFTWLVTLLGAASVMLIRRTNRTAMDALMGAAGGIMLAASCWSLLQPAILQASQKGINLLASVLPGFIAGGLFICLCDMFFLKGADDAAGRRRRLIFSITLHNIPEGLAVGIAFGALAHGIEGANLAAACILAVGIALQNFPEGAAVSLPLRRDGMSAGRAFFYGQLSGMVEPLAGVAGALLVSRLSRLMPLLLSFAAGAMIYVVACDLIPESQKNRRHAVITMITLTGFALMMLMDTMLG